MEVINHPITQYLVFACFFCAIINSFFSSSILKKAKVLEERGEAGSTKHCLLKLGGQVSLIFPMWLLLSFILMYSYSSREGLIKVIAEAGLSEPFTNFAFIFLALSPRVRAFFLALVTKIASVFGGSNTIWWLSCLMLGALLDGLISEAATIVLVASAMKDRFFRHKKSDKFSYTTLAVIFSVLSLASLLLPFNITASMELTSSWGWTHWTIFNLLSWRVALTIFFITFLGALFLRKDLESFPKAEEMSLNIDSPMVGYFIAFILASLFAHVPVFLIGIIGIICVLEKETDAAQHKIRLEFPLLVSIFTYAMEIYAHLLSGSVEALYSKLGASGSAPLTVLFGGLNEHIPGDSFIEFLSSSSSLSQEIGLLALAVAGGIAIFSTSVNIVAYKILRDSFPEQVISGGRILIYTLPIAFISFLFLNLTYFF